MKSAKRGEPRLGVEMTHFTVQDPRIWYAVELMQRTRIRMLLG